MENGNIFAHIPDDLSSEVFEVLVDGATVKIERIVSRGHTSPAAGWYDQEQHEWVIVLQGSAGILFEGGTALNLNEGDYVNIPAHRRHRVVSTGAEPETVWLAVHY